MSITDTVPAPRRTDTPGAVLDLGGNRVARLGTALSSDATSRTLADHAYRYEILVLAPGEVARRPELRSAALWCVSGSVRLDDGRDDAAVTIVHEEHAALVEQGGFVLRSDGEASAVLLLAGATDRADGVEEAPPRVLAASELKRVVKPWGEELWINGRHPGFAFKRIRLNAGARTSLQYHEHKRETNLLVRGLARLHHAEVAGRHDGPILQSELGPVSTVDVAPPVLHRIEATTDVELFEVSTPHLDDVIRVSDDARRPDGLVVSEHDAAR